MLRLLLLSMCISSSLFAKPLFIGIAGASASGKTTFAEKIAQALPEALLINLDSYYKDLSHLPFDERESVNFDHPDSLEFALLKEHLNDLKNGLSIEQPIYNFHHHAREKETKFIEPTHIVLVEGILLLAVEEIRDFFDIKIYIDTDEDVCVFRRLERDMSDRSRTFASIKEQYLKTVKPMYNLFIKPSMKSADIIISGENNQVAVDLILAKLNSQMLGF